MALLQFGAYTPDTSDLNQDTTDQILNVLPRADGYGPLQSLQALTSALPAACRGYFHARTADGISVIFAGTSTDLYKLDNTTLAWAKVSLGGGPYAALANNANWQFEQFNNIVLATQANAVLQEFDVTTSSAFANTAGSPPQASYIAIVNRFVVLSGLFLFPYRIQWSGLNDRTQWASGVNSSDFQDLPNGGVVRGATGGELGFILQDQAIRRMLFIPGSDVIFQIDRIHRDVGALAPYSIVTVENNIYFLSPRGFMQMDGISGALTPIGSEQVDRTFFSIYDASQPQLMIGAAASDSNIVVWAFKTLASGNTTAFDFLLIYHHVLNRWVPANISGQYLAPIAKPGQTLEGLDFVVPGAINITGAVTNGGLIRLTVTSTAGWTTGDIKAVQGVKGTVEANTQPYSGTGPSAWKITVIDATHIDLQGSTFANAYVSGGIVGGSVDAYLTSLDNLTTVPIPKLSAMDTTGALCFFTGDNLEGTIQTAEQSAIARRMFVSGFYPVTDAPTLFGSVSMRENLNATAAYTGEQTINAQGFVPSRADTRYARGKIRIPAGTVWTYARGIEPEFKQTGKR